MVASTESVDTDDPIRKYGIPTEECKLCNRRIVVPYMKEHLMAFHKDVKGKVKKGKLSNGMILGNFDDKVDSDSYRGEGVSVDEVGSNSNEKEAQDLLLLDIGRFFFENGIPLNTVQSPSFVKMIQSMANYGPDFDPPNIDELNTWILEEQVRKVDSSVDDVMRRWKKAGVSILSNGWSDIKDRSMLNFFVNSPEGTVFWKTVYASDVLKDENLLFELLDNIVEEIGEDVVVQVVTENTSIYKAAGTKLMEKRKNIYWTPCAAHCIDVILEEIGKLPQHKNALLKAKKVSNYIYNRGRVLTLMMKYTKKDLVRPAVTRSLTSYLTLQNMLQLKQSLQDMFSSEEWEKSTFANKKEAKDVRKIILKDKTFWPSVVYAIKTTNPLVGLLRLIDASQMPAMGFIYGAMDEAKDEIARNLGGEEASYKEIWEIIDARWEFQLHKHLHAAAHFLNPQFQYADNFSASPEMKSGLDTCMDKLIVDQKVKEQARMQLDAFVNKSEPFCMKVAQSTIKKWSPACWWESYGFRTPQLMNFAVRILSLTCSSSRCECNSSTNSEDHRKKRNRLSRIRRNKVAYIMYNKKLKDRNPRKNGLKEDEDPLIVDAVPSDDEWIVDQGEGYYENTSKDSDDDDDEQLTRSNIKPKDKRKKPLSWMDDDD